jgi:hypothetical protein
MVSISLRTSRRLRARVAVGIDRDGRDPGRFRRAHEARRRVHERSRQQYADDRNRD